MILTNEFSIEDSIDRVWSLMNELENVVACMPGAVYEGRDGEDYNVSIKLKVGAITSHFKGSVRFIEKDEATHTVVVRGAGKDRNGKGAAKATVTARLSTLSTDLTRVAVNTDLSMTGPLAQFGSGVISDIASLLLAQFTDNLHRDVLARANAAGADAQAAPKSDIHVPADHVESPKEREAVELGAIIGVVALSYLRKFVAPLACLLIGWFIGRSY